MVNKLKPQIETHKVAASQVKDKSQLKHKNTSKSKKLKNIKIASEGSSTNASEDDDQELSDDNQSDTPLIHETLLKKTTDNPPKIKAPKPKKIQTDETFEEKNCRTVFVGNVPIECASKKSSEKSLLEHLLNPLKEKKPLASRARIESIRFRGIPLAVPIADEQKVNEKAIQRSKAWQEAQAESKFDDETGGRAGRRGAKPLKSTETTATPPVQLLTPGQKRKIGYVTGNFHPEAKSCIAYVVIAHSPEESKQESKDLTASQEESKDLTASQEESKDLTAKELTTLIASQANGTSFLDHVLRCDIAWTASSKTKINQTTGSINVDEQRRTLFIGGLDFLEEEDSIRKAVEMKLLEEKDGLPENATSWVERVRVVRDKATSLNKGFAYVLLRTQDAVEEMLALPEQSFKIGKRKVRLQKCLATGQASAIKKFKDPKSDKSKKIDNQNKRLKSNQSDQEKGSNERKHKFKLDLTKEIETKYKGPDQSKELANLSKLERKEIKSSNQLRVERRMLKKQNKLKLKILSFNNSKKILDTQSLNPVKNKFKNNKKFIKLASATASKSKSKSSSNPKFKSKIMKKPSKTLPKKS